MLNAPDPASPTVNIDSRFAATRPDQNAGHTACINGQLSCIDNCELVATTISDTNTLHKANPTSARRHSGVARPHHTAKPTHSNGILAPAYRGPNDNPAFHQ